MDLRYVDELPIRGRRNSKETNNSLQRYILKFYESDADYAELEFDQSEYMSSESLISGARKAIRALNLPLRAVHIQGGVYLRRTD